VLEIAIDALDILAVRPFWKAVMGYVDEPGSTDPTDPLADPFGQGPTIWFQQMDAPRPQRNRIHFDICVPHDEAARRIEAAVAAGGVLRNDAGAPAFWLLADPEGNEVCVTTWQGRDSRARSAVPLLGLAVDVFQWWPLRAHFHDAYVFPLAAGPHRIMGIPGVKVSPLGPERLPGWRRRYSVAFVFQAHHQLVHKVVVYHPKLLVGQRHVESGMDREGDPAPVGGLPVGVRLVVRDIAMHDPSPVVSRPRVEPLFLHAFGVDGAKLVQLYKPNELGIGRDIYAPRSQRLSLLGRVLLIHPHPVARGGLRRVLYRVARAFRRTSGGGKQGKRRG
jgi:hypothetical protein